MYARFVVTLIALLALMSPGRVFSQVMMGPTSQPAGGAATQPAVDPQALLQEMGDLQGKLEKALPSLEDLSNPDKRAEARPKVLPLIQQLLSTAHKFDNNPRLSMLAQQMDADLQPLLAIFGDDATLAELKKQSEAKDDRGQRATAALMIRRWIDTNKDAAAQGKLLDEVQASAKTQPNNDSMVVAMLMMTDIAPADDKTSDRAKDIILADFKGDLVERVREDVTAERKLRSLEGKPLALTGLTTDGKTFNTADWKGKVILVDFWATWCGPCLAELPNIQKLYADNHAKGLEVVGVSSDEQPEMLTKFLSANKEKMPWPQFFDAQKPGTHAMAIENGVNKFPTMLLIDRKGIVRTVKGRVNYEQLVPKLLEEKAE